ncbi:hypothetical protein BH09BAC4_BH09BAC4_09400 [soil metagenome]
MPDNLTRFNLALLPDECALAFNQYKIVLLIF